jgi:hypothetical protein
MIVKKHILLGAWSVISAGLVFACGDDEGGGDGGPPAKTPAQLFCEAVEKKVTECGAATPCDQALVGDCGEVVAVLSDSYIQAATACIEAGGGPLGCLGSSLGAAEPSAAHQAFASQFCSSCAFGVTGCEGLFFSQGEGSEVAVAGALVLPFGDDVVNELATECASGITCLATFTSCAQGVLASRAIPDQTLGCVVDSLTNPVASSANDACASGTATQTGTDTGGGTGTQTMNCVDDGVCSPYDEGCICADCVAHPSC